MLISNDFSFKDVDECQLSPNICEQKCINVQGSYYVRLIKGDER